MTREKLLKKKKHNEIEDRKISGIFFSLPQWYETRNHLQKKRKRKKQNKHVETKQHPSKKQMSQ